MPDRVTPSEGPGFASFAPGPCELLTGSGLRATTTGGCTTAGAVEVGGAGNVFCGSVVVAEGGWMGATVGDAVGARPDAKELVIVKSLAVENAPSRPSGPTAATRQ